MNPLLTLLWITLSSLKSVCLSMYLSSLPWHLSSASAKQHSLHRSVPTLLHIDNLTGKQKQGA